MSRRIVVLSLDWLRAKDPRTTLGQASLLAQLTEAPELEVVPLSRAVNAPEFDEQELLDATLAACRGADDLAVGVYVWNEGVVQRLLGGLRRGGFGGRIILGGPQISFVEPGVMARYPAADLGVRGAGEEALLALARGVAPAQVAGVVAQGGADLGAQAKPSLDALASPILTGVLPVGRFMRWETQRGCAFACTFCQHRAPDNRVGRGPLAPARVRAEIGALIAGGAQDIAVLDPIFQSNPSKNDILRRFAEGGFRGRLSLQSRFEMIDEAHLDAAAGLNVRFEFGLQTTHAAEGRAVRRINDMEKVERAIGQLHRRGLSFEVSLIYGLPEQTPESFAASLDWCGRMGVPVVRAFPLMLLRGSELERQRARWNLRENNDVLPLVVESDSFSEAGWQQMRAMAEAVDGGPVRVGLRAA